MDESHVARDEGRHDKYYHVMLNMYDDDLDPYEYRLLGHYKRVGYTYQGTRKIAEICRMSVGQVSKARKALTAKGFIRVELLTAKSLRDSGITLDRSVANSTKICVVTVVDKMAENIERYRSLGEQRVIRGVNNGRTPNERKKERNKKEPVGRKREAKKRAEHVPDPRIEAVINSPFYQAHKTYLWTEPFPTAANIEKYEASIAALKRAELTPEQAVAYAKKQYDERGVDYAFIWYASDALKIKAAAKPAQTTRIPPLFVLGKPKDTQEMERLRLEGDSEAVS